MARTKQVVPVIPDNVWHILEMVGEPMKLFLSNFGLEQYVWMLPDIREVANKEEVARAPLISCLKMPIKINDLVMLILIIPIRMPIPC